MYIAYVFQPWEFLIKEWPDQYIGFLCQKIVMPFSKKGGSESHFPVSRTSSPIHEIASPKRCTKSFDSVSHTALPWESKLIELILDILVSLEWWPIILLTPRSQIKVWPRDHCGKSLHRTFALTCIGCNPQAPGTWSHLYFMAWSDLFITAFSYLIHGVSSVPYCCRLGES